MGKDAHHESPSSPLAILLLGWARDGRRLGVIRDGVQVGEMIRLRVWLTKMRAAMYGFLYDQHGAELVEWAILTFLVVIVSYALLVTMREEVTAMFVRLLGRFAH